MYRQWYKESVSQHLSEDEKLAVVYRISELTLRNPIWLDKDKNYIDQFPELAPHSNTKHISGLQLCAVMEAIVDEMQSGQL